VLIESSLETLPSELASSRKAKAVARRYGIPPKFVLLDTSIFYEEMKRRGISTRRGRPDIVHQFLLATQYSPLNRWGMLRVYIHTWKGDIIEVSERARIPKNYFQFLGLMQKLYIEKAVPSKEDPLLRLIEGKGLKAFLEDIGAERLILLHESGRNVERKELAEYTFPQFIFGVGGFPHGDFSESVLSLSSDRLSLYGGIQLDAWMAADRLICALEEENKPLTSLSV